MPIPDFIDNYFLPPGEHLTSLQETEKRFAHTTQSREKVWQCFTSLWNRLLQFGIKPKAMLIDGSFVTGRKDPGDVDCAILVPPEAIIEAMTGKNREDRDGIAILFNPENQHAIRSLFGAHFLLAPNDETLQAWSYFFRKGPNGDGLRARDPERDPEWVIIPEEKGILRVEEH